VFSFASVPLTPPWKEECVALVLATDAIRLCRGGGWEQVPSRRAVPWVDRLGRREMAEIRGFLARARLCAFSLREVDDGALLALLRTRVLSGQLVVVRAGSQDTEVRDSIDAKRTRVVRAIQAESPHGLSYRGRRYRLVVDSQLYRLADRDGFEVVSRQDAVEVLHGLAAGSGHARAGLAQHLTEAAGLLTPDWRPPRVPDGLVLLRRIVIQQAVGPDLGPTLTPSQLKKLGQKHWIEIELVDLDGEPCSLPYRLEVPGQGSRAGKLDDQGFVGVYEIEAGTGKLFIDGPAEVDDTVELAVKMVDELGQPIAGVSVSFNAGGSTLSAASDGDGVAKVERRRVTTGTVRATDEKALRQILYDRWRNARGEEWFVPPDGEPCSIVEVKRAEKLPAFAVAAAQQRTVVLQPRVVRARLLGMWFDTSKCFLLPTARKTLPMLKDLYAGSPESDLLIVGHTDTAGQPSYNDPLSLERAEAIAAFLRDDVEAWLAWYGAGKPDDKRWGTTEDSSMILALAEQKGEVIPADPPLVAWYQTSRHIDPVDNVMGPVTRRALIREYMSLDGTTLPPEIKVTTHGCGENFPIASTGDGQDKLENRRVELFFFDNPLQAPDRPAAILPAPPGKSSKPGSKEYPEWVLRARQTHDFFPGGDVELTSHISVVLTAGGVPVRDRPYKIYLDGGVVLEGTTGADGFLEHHDVPPGDYTLEVDGCQTTVPTLPEDTHRRLQALDDYWDDTDVSTIV